ncbi:DUF1501 domain-containing protein [Roseiconus lacunae]|uniref:DUF1501 domain-containing protein n=1 Tax=Roseiconus lacunae TaxID=2605694 RepID=UPI001E5CB946|nr:DUF1501 domain-containing protein [Roseiconus lacunae]MCD0459708.1 DUF1501 domain-containing protein [Roseiconus lacunae]
MLTSRRSILTRIGPAAAIGMSSWRQSLLTAASEATASEGATRAGRHCVVLWMSGGPSQLDTFDMKPGTAVGGPLKEAQTSVPGLRFSEHLPKLAKQAERLAIMRGVSTKEGDHARGTTLMHTGNPVGTSLRYPSIGSSLSKALALPGQPLPGYVSISPPPIAPQAQSPGFLGPKFAPTRVSSAINEADQNFATLRVDHLHSPLSTDSPRYRKRLELWRQQQQSFLADRNVASLDAQQTTYDAAFEMLGSDAKDAFDLTNEPDRVRSAYGAGTFGQGCLMARRLIERGVPMIEVALGDGLGWDTHADNFERVKTLSRELDSGWATLMDELADRGLLESTTFLWAGEFGRTPTINRSGGRDHFPQAFTCVLAGGGIHGGQAFGATANDGAEVVEGKIECKDLMATLCAAVDVDPELENETEEGRPIKISEGIPVDNVLA